MSTASESVAIEQSPSSLGEAAPTPPLPPVRGNGLFVRVDAAFAVVDAWFARWIPVELNPLAQAGAAANLALLVAVATGVLMLVWYSPSVQFAYSSLAALNGRTLGGTVRALHRYSSDLTMLLLLVHAGRVFVARKFSGARWLPWISGIAMLGLIWFIGWTGFWLVWDQPAQQVAVSSMRLVDSLPIFGEPMGRLYIADRTVPSLLFFVVFFLHMLLPLAIAVGLAVHVMRLSRARLLPRRSVCLGLIGGLIVAALILPAPLDAPARMAFKAPAFTVDAWYLAPLALALRFREAGLWVALGGGTLLTALVPWVLARRQRKVPVQAKVDVSRCHACTQCAQDCPFDAITMVARTDGKKFAAQAQVDPARCIGCGICAGSCDSEGIVLPWFDTRTQETRIGDEIAVNIARGAPPWVALVCGEIDGGLDGSQPRAAWSALLPGYQIHVVPTATWVRPKLVERLSTTGVKGVLVVRDARAEAWSRDGRRWVAERMAGTRTPTFRPERAVGGAWRVVDFDAARPALLTAVAADFRTARESGITRAGQRPLAVFGGVVALAALLIVAVLVPSHLRVGNPISAEPEFVFSFKALGTMQEPPPLDPVAEAAKPIHMRGRVTEKPRRVDVVVELSIDGITQTRSFAAKGLSHDGPAIGEWRQRLTPGEHQVRVAILNTAAQSVIWDSSIQASARRLNVLTYETAMGFAAEPGP